MKFLFVVIPARSGSTLCASILDTSDQVSFQSGQDNRYEMRSLLRFNGKIPTTGYGFDEYFGISIHGSKDYKKMNYEKIHKELRLSGNKIVSDKCASYLRCWEGLQEYFSQHGDVYFIGSIRNPRYVVQDNPRNALWNEMATDSIAFLEKCKNKYFYRYEDLIKNPDEVISDMQDFLKIKINIKGSLIGKKTTGKLGVLKNFNTPNHRCFYPFDKNLANRFGYYPSLL